MEITSGITVSNREFNLLLFIPKEDRCWLCSKSESASNEE